jgi:hypothetical protein
MLMRRHSTKWPTKVYASFPNYNKRQMRFACALANTASTGIVDARALPPLAARRTAGACATNASWAVRQFMPDSAATDCTGRVWSPIAPAARPAGTDYGGEQRRHDEAQRPRGPYRISSRTCTRRRVRRARPMCSRAATPADATCLLGSAVALGWRLPSRATPDRL